MPNGTIWLVASGLALGSTSTQSIARDRTTTIQNFTAPGNLESNYDLGCIQLKDAKPIYNPVDLFKASKACITARRYDDAVRLIALGGAYGRFDMRRVSDPTARQAVTVARMEIFDGIPEENRQKFNAALAGLMNDAATKAAFCAEVSRIGPPSYVPRYMIQHGMGAFFGGTKDGIVDNFDSKSAWAETFSSYLKCTPS